MFASPNSTEHRAAYSLVEGEVVMRHDGRESYVQVLDSAQVRAIASDLATVTEKDVRTFISSGNSAYPHDGLEGELNYVMTHLGHAQEFTARLASRGDGLIYFIG